MFCENEEYEREHQHAGFESQWGPMTSVENQMELLFYAAVPSYIHGGVVDSKSDDALMCTRAFGSFCPLNSRRWWTFSHFEKSGQ